MSNFPATFVNILAWILYLALFGRVIMSYINIQPSNPLYPLAGILIQITEPILAPIRKVLPRFGMLDFSPMVAIILISVVQRIFLRII